MTRSRRRLRWLLATTGVAVLLASPPAAAGHGQTTLYTNEVLTVGQYLSTPAGQYNSGHRLVLQPDGNLVLYRWNNKAVWATWTQGNPPGFLGMQSDGNLVLYRQGNVPVWSTGTTGLNRRLQLNPDGNLVVYAGAASQWASGTNENFGANRLFCGFDANRGADVRVRKPAAGPSTSNRVRRVIEWGAWDWNAAAGPHPHFVQIDPGPTLVEVESTADNDMEAWGQAQGASTNACPVTGFMTMRVGTGYVIAEEQYQVVGPHEFGHLLGLPHYPSSTPGTPSCGSMTVMWPGPEDLVTCARHQPTSTDVAQLLRIYNEELQ